VATSARLADAQHPAPGREVRAVVALEVKKGWHIYANPTGVDILKPTTLTLEPGQPAGGLEVSYPKGQSKVLGSLGKDKVALYGGKVEIPVRFTLAGDARPGKRKVEFKLKYQACDDKVCLAPATLTIPLEFTIGTSR
jgi:DsbC/DsbD-like thiol-disulfide interchange protein